MRRTATVTAPGAAHFLIPSSVEEGEIAAIRQEGDDVGPPSVASASS